MDGIRSALRARRSDLLAAAFLVVMAGAFLSPAVTRGASFGPYDLLSLQSGLTQSAAGTVHNNINGDVAAQTASWLALNWRLVHQGEFPLWNDFSLMGMPQFLNFESAVLSLPSLIAYLAPIREAMLVTVFVKLLLAGLGVYVCCRVLGAGPLGAAFGGLTYMLCGPFAAWLGWPLSDVMAWTGWIAAFLLLAYRDPRPRWVVLLAVSVAFAVYGGFPEANLLLLGFLGLMFAAWAIAGRSRPDAGGLLRAAAGGAAGVALSAPLWLPGIGILADSVRAGDRPYYGLPFATTPMVFSQGFYGLPVAGSTYYGPPNYYETVSYLGVFAALLAAVALVRWWRRPLVIGLVAMAAVAVLVTWVPHVAAVLSAVHLGNIAFNRARFFVAFAVAVLAALGLDTMLAAGADARARPAVLAGSALTALAVALALARGLTENLPNGFLGIRIESLAWPAFLLVAVLLLGLLVWRRPALLERPRARPLMAGGLLAGQAAFLLSAGLGIETFSHQFFPETPATATLKGLIGGELVALDGANATDVRQWTGLGLYPNVNVGYQVRQFTGYDPVLPRQYFLSWPGPGPKRVGAPSLFVPAVDSADLARRYGIGYLLVAPGRQPPPGAVRVGSIGGDTVYKVPGSSRFEVASGPADARVASVARTSNHSWRLHVVTSRPATVVLKVTYVAGWHASAAGKQLPVRRYNGVMAAVSVPAGEQDVAISYWPDLMTAGLALAGLAVLLLAAWSLLPRLRTRGA